MQSRDIRHEAIWVILLAAASLLGSLAFACATPFAALATIAATRMRPRAGLATMILAWAANQAIGFGLLHYPRSWNCAGWGLAIGIAALTAMLCAHIAARILQAKLVGVALAFAVAFVGYEAVLYAATVPLASGTGAFTAGIVLRVAEINLLALLGLVALSRAVVGVGLAGLVMRTQPE